MTTLDDDPLDDAVDAAVDDEARADDTAAEAEDVVAEPDVEPDAEAADEAPTDPNETVESTVLAAPPAGEERDGDGPADLVVPPAPADKPSRREHRAEMRASARRVRRVVRHIDAWSVFKVASIFVVCIWGVIVLASLLIWRAAVSSGSVENTEDFIVDLGFQDFNFNPEQMFEALLSAGAVIAIAAIFFTVLLTVLFNLICDITGGLRVTMIEQDLADARRRSARD